jgi:hypothetical protein
VRLCSCAAVLHNRHLTGMIPPLTGAAPNWVVADGPIQSAAIPGVTDWPIGRVQEVD